MSEVDLFCESTARLATIAQELQSLHEAVVKAGGGYALTRPLFEARERVMEAHQHFVRCALERAMDG